MIRIASSTLSARWIISVSSGLITPSATIVIGAMAGNAGLGAAAGAGAGLLGGFIYDGYQQSKQ